MGRDKNYKIESIESVFLNRPNDYTLLVRKNNQLEAQSLYVGSCGYGGIKLITDARDGIWANVKKYKNVGGGSVNYKYEIDIHIRSKDDIQGGQWREKIGKGPENVGGVHRIQ